MLSVRGSGHDWERMGQCGARACATPTLNHPPAFHFSASPAAAVLTHGRRYVQCAVVQIFRSWHHDHWNCLHCSSVQVFYSVPPKTCFTQLRPGHGWQDVNMMDPITADLMRLSLRTDSISPALLRSRKMLCTIFMHILQAEIITTCLLFLTFTVSLIWFDDIIGELPLLPLHIFILAFSHTLTWRVWTE